MPPRGSLLYAVEVPTDARGEALGDTLFVSSAAAYEALPVARQRSLLGLRAGECVGVVGMPDEEALALIQELSDWVTRPEFLYRHRWRLGDLLMWDNCCAQHLAVKDYDLPQRRLMHCVAVNGLVPA